MNTTEIFKGQQLKLNFIIICNIKHRYKLHWTGWVFAFWILISRISCTCLDLHLYMYIWLLYFVNNILHLSQMLLRSSSTTQNLSIRMTLYLMFSYFSCYILRVIFTFFIYMCRYYMVSGWLCQIKFRQSQCQ